MSNIETELKLWIIQKLNNRGYWGHRLINIDDLPKGSHSKGPTVTIWGPSKLLCSVGKGNSPTFSKKSGSFIFGLLKKLHYQNFPFKLR